VFGVSLITEYSVCVLVIYLSELGFDGLDFAAGRVPTEEGGGEERSKAVQGLVQVPGV